MALTLKRPLELEPLACSPRPAKRRRCLPMCVQDAPPSRPALTRPGPPSPRQDIEESPFYGAASPLTREDIAQYVKEEIRRLRRRRLIPPKSSDASEGSPAPGATSQAGAATSNAATSAARADKPIFTYKQMMSLVEVLAGRREEAVRAAFDGVLSSALEEQERDCQGFTQRHVTNLLARTDTPSYMS